MSKTSGALPLIALAGTAAIVFLAAPDFSGRPTADGLENAKPQEHMYFARCADARAAGVAPISKGQPGYRSGLDGDGDGVACEPYHGR